MKKIIISTVVCFTLLFSSVSQAALDPKLKMLGTMAGYGVVGGALLGTATMAFGANGRAIAKGASLGLYAGLIFGGYIILNYEMKKRGYGQDTKENYYPDSSGEYEDPQGNFSFQFDEFRLAQVENKKDPKVDPSFSWNFLSYEF